MGGDLLGRMPVTPRADFASPGGGTSVVNPTGNMRVPDGLGNVAGTAFTAPLKPLIAGDRLVAADAQASEHVGRG
jgi:hypothetical protein